MQTGADSVTIERLEAERRNAIAELQQIEHALGQQAPRHLTPAQARKRRETLIERLRKGSERLRLANATVKQGRRVGQALLLQGMQRPRNERELVATLYRMFTDAVAPHDQTEEQKIVVRIARDYVQTGVLV